VRGSGARARPTSRHPSHAIIRRIAKCLLKKSHPAREAMLNLPTMNAEVQPQARIRVVLVVGVDLGEVSEQLLRTAQNLLHSADEAELHVVHVVRPESLIQRIEEPPGSVGTVDRSQAEAAHWQLEHMCDAMAHRSSTRVVVHTPVGRPAEELVRIAKDVGADVLVVEAHDPSKPRRVLHRSVVARVARTAPCSVLMVRPNARAVQALRAESERLERESVARRPARDPAGWSLTLPLRGVGEDP
jgi:nucleotide-binding universal stress UspA family protein